VSLAWAWIQGFFRFWYHFIVGDDWLIAAGVLAGLLLTALLKADGHPVFWLVPLLVLAVVGVSLRRASRA
jgi:hypothetical protein